MAKRRKKQVKRAKAKKAKSKKTKKKKVARGSTRKAVKRKKTAKKTARKAAKRASKKKTAKKRRAPRRTEADMSWSEVRAARKRKGAGREDRIVRDFGHAVNMTPQALEDWLKTDESRAVGTPRSSNASESVGHWSGRRIIEIKQKKAGDYTAEDYAHMRKVAAYVKRHIAQQPDGDVRETPWRYSLMNWGHDPLK